MNQYNAQGLLKDSFLNFTSKRTRWVFIISTGLFIALFLNIFQPFTIRNGNGDLKFILIISGYGVVGSIILYLNEFLLRKQLSHFFNPSKWNNQKGGIWILWHCFTISLGICAYRTYWCCGWEAILTFELYPTMLLRTLLIGIFPFTGMLFYSYYKNTKRQLEARPLPTLNRDLVVLQSAYHQEKLILPPSKIIYIEPADNYVAIHYLDNLQVQKKLIRNTLAKVELQLKVFPSLIRCHRSFIVNLDYVQQIRGNSKQMELLLKEQMKAIPVSRKYIPIVKKRIVPHSSLYRVNTP